MTNTVNKPLGGQIAAGLQRPTVGWTFSASPATLFTGATSNTVNVFDNINGSILISGNQANTTTTASSYYSNRTRGFTYIGFNVNNAFANYLLAARQASVFAGTWIGNYYVATSQGVVFRNSIFSSTVGWTTTTMSGIFCAAIENSNTYNQIYMPSLGTGTTYFIGRNASGHGVVGSATTSSGTLNPAYTRTDGVQYTCGAYDPLTAQILVGATDGNIYRNNGGTLITWSGLPGTGPIKALHRTGSRFLMIREAGTVYYSSGLVFNAGTWTAVAAGDSTNGFIGAGVDTSGFNTYTNKFYVDTQSGIIMTTGDKCSVWYSSDGGLTWTRNTSINQTLMGSTNFGYVRLLYQRGHDEWGAIVAAFQTHSITAGICKNTAYAFKITN